MLHGIGYDTGVDLADLIECAGWLQERLGLELPGQLGTPATSRSPDGGPVLSGFAPK